jgi:hypothetical protein
MIKIIDYIADSHDLSLTDIRDFADKMKAPDRHVTIAECSGIPPHGCAVVIYEGGEDSIEAIDQALDQYWRARRK